MYVRDGSFAIARQRKSKSLQFTKRIWGEFKLPGHRKLRVNEAIEILAVSLFALGT
jgi:hypothetical protein